MHKITLTALGAAVLLALSGTAANAADTTPICSKTVTDNCMQREGHAAAPRHATAKHHVTRKHHVARKHRVAARHHAVKKHRVAAAATKAPPAAKKPAPAPARKM